MRFPPERIGADALPDRRGFPCCKGDNPRRETGVSEENPKPFGIPRRVAEGSGIFQRQYEKGSVTALADSASFFAEERNERGDQV